MSEAEPDNATFADVSLAEWSAAFAANVAEFPATRFVIIAEGPLVRIAFGRNGGPVDAAGTLGPPVYTAAISMAPSLAVELRDVLNKVLHVQATPASPNG